MIFFGLFRVYNPNVPSSKKLAKVNELHDRQGNFPSGAFAELCCRNIVQLHRVDWNVVRQTLFTQLLCSLKEPGS